MLLCLVIRGEADLVTFKYTNSSNEEEEVSCLASVFIDPLGQCILANVTPGIQITVRTAVTHNSIQGPWIDYPTSVPPFFKFTPSSDIAIGFDNGTPMYSINFTFIGHFEKIEIEFTNGGKITQGKCVQFKFKFRGRLFVSSFFNANMN